MEDEYLDSYFEDRYELQDPPQWHDDDERWESCNDDDRSDATCLGDED